MSIREHLKPNRVAWSWDVLLAQFWFTHLAWCWRSTWGWTLHLAFGSFPSGLASSKRCLSRDFAWWETFGESVTGISTSSGSFSRTLDWSLSSLGCVFGLIWPKMSQNRLLRPLKQAPITTCESCHSMPAICSPQNLYASQHLPYSRRH